jgi:transcriptional regulator with XRE-family HTH domain
MNPHERKTLGDFLKTRRARLQPEDVGLPPGQRRRTPGLRREEVAMLAGVSVTWYSWIEQGRDVGFSQAVLASIGRALRLAPHEREYLFHLAQKTDTSPPVHASPQTLDPVLMDIVEHQSDYPAYIMGPYWHLWAWNQSACGLFGDFGTIAPRHRNMIWYTMVIPETRTLVVDWAERAQRLVAEFRADCGPYLTDPWLAEFVEELREASPEFGGWWEQHDVHRRDGGYREFDHPQVGRVITQQTTFRLGSDPQVKLVIHVPLDAEQSKAKLRRLIAGCS